LDDARADAIDLQTEANSTGSSDIERDPTPVEGCAQVNTLTTGAREDTDEEDEPWVGFGSGAYLSHSQRRPLLTGSTLHPATQIDKIRKAKNGPGPLKCRVGVKPRGQDLAASKRGGKRKAPQVTEKYVAQHPPRVPTNVTSSRPYSRPRKRAVSGMKRVDTTTDLDEITSKPGGFIDDEDSCSAAADREEIIGPTKSGRRSATVRTTLQLCWCSRPSHVHFFHRPRSR